LQTKVFGKVLGGYFVDIGANDGVTFSNTYFFENHGWQGVCVEPIPEVFEKLIRNRKCKCLSGVISDNNAEYAKLLHVTGSEMLSGIVDNLEQKYLERINQENAGGTEILEVKNYNFNQVIENTKIDYLSIDTEGSEFPILQSIDFTKFAIKVISVENNYQTNDIRIFLKTKGFKYLKTIGADEIYINQRYRHLVNVFDSLNLLIWRIIKQCKRILKSIIKKS
jgi:FkbM family methyltransferase